MIYGVSDGGGTGWWTSDHAVADFADIARLGASMVRLDFQWSTVQPTDSSHWSWTQCDMLVNTAQAAGLDVLVIFSACPTWAGGSGNPPSDNAQYATFCGTVAARYAPSGIHHYEVWNEPDAGGNWGGTPSASAFVTTLAAATTAIKAADASAVVVSGGIAAWNDSYLTSMCTAGFSDHCDALGIHPYSYPYTPGTLAANSNNSWGRLSVQSPSIISVLTANSLSIFPIWLTEFGAPTYGLTAHAQSGTVTLSALHEHADVSEEYQAVMATDVVTQAKTIANVEALFWYADQDEGTTYNDPEKWFGLRRYDGTHKPAWHAFKAAIA